MENKENKTSLVATNTAKLVNVKSIVTILLTIVYAWLAIIGTVPAKDFSTMMYIIISFYFGTQAAKVG